MTSDVSSRIAVIVPARDATATLPRCLEALRPQIETGDELVVVDDGSVDGTAEVAERLGACVIRSTPSVGPAGARNRGVEASSAPLLFFVDADVCVAEDTLSRVRDHFRSPRLGAVIGSYDDEPADGSFVARYKNLAHHFVHQRAARRTRTFFAACGAVRREAFTAVGGFDASRYPRPSIEDIELGGRLSRSGIEIRLDRDLQVKHLKAWRLGSLLRTDLLDRAIPWTRLALERDGFPDDLNLRRRERLVALGAIAFLACVAATPLFPSLAVVAVALGAGQVAANAPFFRFLRERGGVRLAVAGFALHQLYYATAVCGLGIGVVLHLASSRGERSRVAAQPISDQASNSEGTDSPAPARKRP